MAFLVYQVWKTFYNGFIKKYWFRLLGKQNLGVISFCVDLIRSWV